MFRRHAAADADEVLPGLLLGAAPGARAAARAAQHGHVTHVLDLRERSAAEATHWPQGVVVRRAPTPDGQAPDPDTLAALVVWLRDELADGSRVLVHCTAGQGRGPTVVLAYLVAMGYPLPEAYSHVRRARPQIAPTDAQLRALTAFAATHTP